MNLLGILVILGIALVFSLLFVVLLSNKGPWGSFWTFFLILLLGIWAISLWITPVGPTIGGASWAALLVAGLILALLLALSGAPAPKRRRKRNAITGKIIKDENESSLGFSFIFWILLGILGIAIVFGILI